MSIEARPYTPEDAPLWNQLVATSRNGTFLFDRGYMDYHSDRYSDHSLIFTDRGKPIALLPANICGDTLYSHQGLTYGGLVLSHAATAGRVCQMMRVMNAMLAGEGIKRVVYKAVPHIYHRYPAEEDLYAIANVCGARLCARHISSTISTGDTPRWAESRLSGLRKARNCGLTVCESDDIGSFWTILDCNLRAKYNARPVHTAAELCLLKERFSDSIRLWMAYDGTVPVGGALLYIMPDVAHTQYISATPEGKREGALDILFDHIIGELAPVVSYFDFGKSSDGDGHDLNSDLIFQKEGFGGRGICYDWWQWDL